MSWALLFIFLLIVEIVTVNLVSIWFAIGAMAAYITSLITESFLIQIAVFIVVSIIALACTRKISKKLTCKQMEKTNADRAIGKEGVLLEGITKYEFGEIKVDGKVWTANSKKPISKGEKVVVIGIEGVKLIVQKKEEDE